MNSIYKYLFKINNTYNNPSPFYDFKSLPTSDIISACIFAGKPSEIQPSTIAKTYLYLELSKDLNQENYYWNIQRYLNLISLETMQISSIEILPIAQTDNFDSIFTTYKSDTFFYPKVSYHGMAPKPGHIMRVQQLAELIQERDIKDLSKFDNALNTFVWALEIKQLPNPHLKFTLYMTLLLSSIEQLCQDPEYCTSHEECPDCKKIRSHHKQGRGQMYVLEQLVRRLLTGSSVDIGIKRVQLLYSELRSKFLHTGKLYGEEKNGGFLSEISRVNELVEDEINILQMNKKLLEQFLAR